MRPKRQGCPYCRWALPSESEPDSALTQHGHQLYLIAIGLTWRLRWAPSAAEAKAGALADLSGAKGLVPAKARVRRARASDLTTIEEARA